MHYPIRLRGVVERTLVAQMHRASIAFMDGCQKGMVMLMGDTPEDGVYLIETSIYDIEEIYPDCTVQVLRNSVTGEVSVGWWENDKEPEWSD